MSTSTISDSTSELLQKIKGAHICMLTTLDENDQLVSQPMTLQEIDGSGDLWFFTSGKTSCAQNILAHREVNLSFADSTKSLYVSVSGEASQVRDRARLQSLWNPTVGVWFPKGIDDPHLLLLKVVPHCAEYWDNESNTMMKMLTMAKATLTGRPPEVKPGEHGNINL